MRPSRRLAMAILECRSSDHNDVLVRFENKTAIQNGQNQIAAQVAKALPNVEIRRIEVVGATVSAELFRNGLLATGLALVAVLIYI